MCLPLLYMYMFIKRDKKARLSKDSRAFFVAGFNRLLLLMQITFSITI